MNKSKPKAKKANGATSPVPSPRMGPRIEIRLRNRDQKRALVKAAQKQKVSMSTFVATMIDNAVKA